MDSDLRQLSRNWRFVQKPARKVRYSRLYLLEWRVIEPYSRRKLDLCNYQ